ncbi:MAG: glycoside hydrolase family 97 protein [Candidatus Azobacteroides sp.]|nr:glycoside hydrolase family 97 protein [Candidatus Azobacteroides sp.]
MKTKHMIFKSFLPVFLFLSTCLWAQQEFTLSSPDGKVSVKVELGQQLQYSVYHENDMLVHSSPIALHLSDGTTWGENPKLSSSGTREFSQVIEAPVYKRKQVKDNFKELTLKFKGNYAVIFRAYNDGVAYRFVSDMKKPYMVQSEQASFNFPMQQKAYISYSNGSREKMEDQFFNSFECPYDYIALSEWDKERFGILPIVTEGPKGKKICITEADLLNYPGMYLYPDDKGKGLNGVFAPYPKELVQGGHNELQLLIPSREPYIARCEGKTQFPWRVIVVAANDYELADNDMVYKLSTPSTGDFSWVKPGKVAWEWWNAWNLYNVDFVTGINNDTYKYYIDFASANGIEYIILDEGWAVNKKADLFQVIPEINLQELADYGKAKNVGLILWAGYYAFDRDMEAVCKHYSEMGIKGFKVDFMDRDDQIMVEFHRRAAEMGAKYKLLIDFHGTYKPTGLHRTYPNVINYEGVYGLENMKWNPNIDQVTYDVTIPFVRQVAGPMDYTQGAMRNASKDNYRAVHSEGMSQGTRCRQLAEYIIFESPLNMLCDSPSNYMEEKECLRFIASVPTVWDNTIAMNGEIAKYITLARQKGNDWYVGSMTNWDARTLELDLSFLGKGEFTGEVFKDGINADKAARDYKKEEITIPADRKLKISMAPGGGYVIKISPKY